MAVLMISGLTYLAFGILIAAIGLIRFIREGSRAGPGPKRWPIIGNLHLLRGYKIPYQGFVDLSKRYGDVFSMQLGSVSAVAVHGIDNIREVLVQKCHQFDSRPNFDRYHQLFHGNKENSLAFCNWSGLQKKRRDLLKDHVFPKVYTNSFQILNDIICEEITRMIDNIKDAANNNNNGNNTGQEEIGGRNFQENETVLSKTKNQFRHNFKNLIHLIDNKHVETIVRFPRHLKSTPSPVSEEHRNAVSIKDKLLMTCGNIFLRYFCSVDMYENRDFRQFVENFDKIFYEVNQGYAYDFLPFLSVFYRSGIRRVQKHSEDIRKFVLEHIVKGRLEKAEENKESDYVDALLKCVRSGGENGLSLETALFSLEDIIGGHSAIGNFLVKLLTFLVDNKTIQNKIREEVERRGKDFVTLEDRHAMPYTEAVIMESLRMISSPIVPHVSNQDTTISGKPVKKDTLVFLNNYELNMSDSLWSDPKTFDPTRFINSETGARMKPAHFLPFGTGKRSCMGYKLVQFVSFVFVANIISQFEICSVPGERYDDVAFGSLALPAQTYRFGFKAR